MEELNKKLAEWAGFQGRYVQHRPRGGHIGTYAGWEYPDGKHRLKFPNFTQSLDACFKWLVPKLVKGSIWHIEMHSKPNFPNVFCVRIEDNLNLTPYYTAVEKDPALALCLAIEKLIDGINQ